MPIPPSAKEIKTAVSKQGCEAIPYPDLRVAAQGEYRKQLTLSKEFASDRLTTANELQAARYRAEIYREQRIKVRTVFKKAILQIKAVLPTMKSGDPLKPDLTKILHELEASQKGHEDAIDQANKAAVKCEEKLRKLKP